MQPLAERLRPKTLDDYIGQKHLVGPGAILRKMIDAGRISSFILWGPPGVGKTTLAQIIANKLETPFYTLHPFCMLLFGGIVLRLPYSFFFQLVRQELLLHEVAFVAVGVLVFLSISQLFHQLGGSIAQVQRHRQVSSGTYQF